MTNTDSPQPNLPEKDPVKTPISDERLKIWIDVIKWFVVSVALASASMVINSRIQDREISIKELDKNDDYLSYILKNDSLNQRLELAEYFSRVLVSERIRKRWEVYRDFLKEQKSKLWHETDSLEQRLQKLIKSDSIYHVQIEKLNIQDSTSVTPQVASREKALKKSSERTTKLLAEVEQQIRDNKGQLNAKLRVAEAKETEQPVRSVTRIDVFYLENTPQAVKQKAETIKTLLDATGIYKVTVKQLLASTNGRTGYNVQSNQIRYDAYEENQARSLKEELSHVNIAVDLSQSNMNTSGYLSIFIVN